jgi:hypothetical protein
MSARGETTMRRHLAWALSIFLALAGLLGATTLPVSAADEPKIAMPQTLHYQSEVTIVLAGQGITSVAEGDFDFARTAFHLTTLTQFGGVTSREELILLDGRLYSFNPDRNRWEYRTLSPAERETAAAGPKVVIHPTARYQQVGTEAIAGAATSHWRASGDYNLLTPAIIQGEFGGFLVEETLTTEAFIGLNDGYLYRQTGQEEGTMTGLGATADPPMPTSSKAIYDYSNFDQPVTITAPEGAVPAGGGGGGAPPLTSADTAALIARMTQFGPPFTAEGLARLLIPAWLPQP